MERQRVQSSNVYSVGYDPQEQRLEVEFMAGGVYEYLGVPRAVYDCLMDAESKGRYVQSVIKPRYPARKVPGTVDAPQVDHR